MKLTIGLFFFLPTLIFAEPSILQSGPSASSSIPLLPVQLVDAWKGLYQTRWEDVWVFGTRSAFYQPQGKALPEKEQRMFISQGVDWQKRVFDAYTLKESAPSNWGWAFFFLQGTQEKTCLLWIASFLKEFHKLENSLKQSQAVVFPAILADDL